MALVFTCDASSGFCLYLSLMPLIRLPQVGTYPKQRFGVWYIFPFSVSCSDLPTTSVQVPQRHQKVTNNPSSSLPIRTSSRQPKLTNGVRQKSKKNGNSINESPSNSPRRSARGTPDNSLRTSIYMERFKANVESKAVPTSKGHRNTKIQPNPTHCGVNTAISSSKRVVKESPPQHTAPPKLPTLSSPPSASVKISKIPTSPQTSSATGSTSAQLKCPKTFFHSSPRIRQNSSAPSLSVMSLNPSNSRQRTDNSKSAPPHPSSSLSNSLRNSHAVNAQSSPRIAGKPNLTSSILSAKSGQNTTATNSPNPQQQHHKGHHRPGHIRSHLNKSNLSASTGKLNNETLIRRGALPAAVKSRPISRELDSLNGKKSGSGAVCKDGKESLWQQTLGYSRPLAPTAKFKSDGEISICAANSPTDGEKQTSPSPPQQQQKNRSGQESGKSASGGGTIKRESNKTAATGSHSAKNSPTASVDSSRSAAAARNRVIVAQSTSNKSAEKKEVGGDIERRETSLRQGAFSRVRSRSLTFFQRIGGAVRRRNSFRTCNRTIQNHSPNTSRNSKIPTTHQRHGDWVFFRGFSGKRREDTTSEAASEAPAEGAVGPSDHHFLAPTSTPPTRLQRSRSRAQRRIELRRTLSLTDAHFIAQAVCEGDVRLIRQLYPDFPRGESIYLVSDRDAARSRKEKHRPTSHRPSTNDEVALPPNFQREVSSGGGSEVSANQRTSASAGAPLGAGAGAEIAPMYQSRKSNNAAAPITGDAQISWRQQKVASRQELLTSSLQHAPPPPSSVIGSHSVSRGNSIKNNDDFDGGPPISHDGVTFSSSVMYVKQQDSHQSQQNTLPPDMRKASIGESLSGIFAYAQPLNFPKCCLCDNPYLSF